MTTRNAVLLPLLALLVLAGSTTAQAATTGTGAAGFGAQWALSNTGQAGGTVGADAHLPQAWALAGGGSASVLVGSVDSGVAFSNPDLAGVHLWTNAAEAGGRAGVDDDGDGCVDDLHGCDFVNGDGDPTDDYGHGTTTASEIVAGFGAQYAGIAPNVSLITAKVLSASGSGTTAEEAAGLAYVADHGARVVNVSIGGSYSSAVHAAIADHPDTLFVAAAGNDGTDDDGASPTYPCADPSPNVLCVGASTRNDTLASFSDHGATSVDLDAPGVAIAAATLTGTATTLSGTSYAAPIVTGVAALAFSQDPSATVAQVKAAILSSVDREPGLAGTSATGGRVNAYRALRALAGDDPGQAATPAASAQSASTVTALTPAVSSRTAAKARATAAAKARAARVAKGRRAAARRVQQRLAQRAHRKVARKHPRLPR